VSFKINGVSWGETNEFVLLETRKHSKDEIHFGLFYSNFPLFSRRIFRQVGGMYCFLLVVVVWVFSVCLHEYGHAWVAYRGGDTSVEEKGYLEMNPIHYAHPLTSFLLPMLFMVIGGIGLPGGAVYINRNLLRSRWWETAVSLAGPAMNLLLALAVTILLRAFLMPHYPGQVATYAMAFVLQLQIMAILFNLIPVPPLDGFGAIEPWLPGEWQNTLRPAANYGLFILVLLFWKVPILNDAFWSCVDGISNSLGVNAELGDQGLQLFRHAIEFWKQS
jgi:Zn-dependent protease